MNDSEINQVYRLLKDAFNNADWTKIEEAMAYLEDYIEVDSEEDTDY